jgi:hypothetical protein
MEKKKVVGKKCKTIGCNNTAVRDGFCIDCHNELSAF